jgi:hypothetical protein
MVIAITIATIAAVRSQGGTLSVVGNVNVATNLEAQSITLGGQTLSAWPAPAGSGGAVQLQSNGVFGADQDLDWSPDLGLQITIPSSGFRDKAIRVYCQQPNCGNNFIALYNSSGDERWVFSMLPDESLRVYSTVDNANVWNVNTLGVGIFMFPDSNYDAALAVGGDTYIQGNVSIDGKLNANGGMDPPYLLLDSETRTAIAQRVAREVAPSKQTGAAVFWNSETKRLEIYVASEGAFYDLMGNLITSITPPTVPGAAVTTRFRIDASTGNVVTDQALHAPRWGLRPGYKFDARTGTFTTLVTSNSPAAIVTASEALELKLYAAPETQTTQTNAIPQVVP